MHPRWNRTQAWFRPAAQHSSLVRCRQQRVELCCRRAASVNFQLRRSVKRRATTQTTRLAHTCRVMGLPARPRLVAERLSDIGIQRELAGLPGWSRRGNALTKTYRFATFPAGITFVTRVADVAESMDHHPDIDIRHTRLTFTLSTHDAGGITANDLRLAREIERLAVESGV